MAERKVESTDKSDGEIVGLCYRTSDGELKYRSSTEAMADIDKGVHSYFVEVDGNRVEVGTRRYLTTSPDFAKNNNLDNLSDCRRSAG